MLEDIEGLIANTNFSLRLIAGLLGSILFLLILYGVGFVYWIYRLNNLPEEHDEVKELPKEAGPLADVYNKYKRENP